MKNFWDERYASDTYIYGEAPNTFFKNQLDRLTPGTILLPAEGEGRNAVYAARKKWTVEAFDSSKVAKQKASMLANKFGVSLHYHLQTIPEFDASKPQYDAIALIYNHFPESVRVSYHQKIIDLLRPGGSLIMEAFHKSQLNNSSGGPPNIDLLYDSKMLENDFSKLNIQYLEEEEIMLDEGEFHRGKANVVRLIAVK